MVRTHLQDCKLVHLSREYSSSLIPMWTQYFNFIKLRRGRVIVSVHGEIDFSRDDIPLEICKELFEKGFPYLELTDLGLQELYPLKPDQIDQAPVPTKKKK